MNRWFPTLLWLLTVTNARADLHVERSMANGVAGTGNPPVVMLESYRGTWQRVDSPAREKGLPPDQYSLYDDAKGETIVFSPGSYMRLPNSELRSQAEKTRQQIEKFVKDGGSVPGYTERGAFPKFEKLEKTKRHDIPCVLYQVSANKQPLGTLCAANATDLKISGADYELLQRSLTYGGSSVGFSIGAEWIGETRFGVPISITAISQDGDGASYQSDIISLRSLTLPDSYFALPAGLREKAPGAVIEDIDGAPMPQTPAAAGGSGRIF